MSIYSPETLQRLAILKQKAIDNTLSLDDMKEAVRLMKGERRNAASAAESSGARKKVAKAAIQHADDALDELGKS